MDGEEIVVPFTVTNRARALPGDLCPNRRLALLLLILYYCRGKKASQQQLYVMDWAIRSPVRRSRFLQYIRGQIEPDQILIRYDPALPRAIALAIANKLIIDRRLVEGGIIKETPQTYRVLLLEKGEKVVDEILSSHDELLWDERLFLESISQKVTQRMIQELFSEALR